MARKDPSRGVQTKGWRHSSVAVTLLAEMAERREAVGQRVVELREQQRWSQEELATKAGVSVKTVSRLENGRYESRRGTIDRVADALGITADELDPPPAPLGLGADPRVPASAAEIQEIRADVAALREDVGQIVELMQQLRDPLADLLRTQAEAGQQVGVPAPSHAKGKPRSGGRRAAS